jgi:transporter family-2 protein
VTPTIWIGGQLVKIFVWAFGTQGAISLLAALICGQPTAALLLDTKGAFGLPVREINWMRPLEVIFADLGIFLSLI